MRVYSWDYIINHNENDDENEHRLHRYDINRPRSRHEHKYSKYKKCLNMMMLIRIKQHLSNIWSSIHEKVKQHWSWVGKGVAYEKKHVLLLLS